MDLLDYGHQVCQSKHYSPRKEEAYLRWIERFLRYHRRRAGKWRHPREIEDKVRELAASSKSWGPLFRFLQPWNLVG
ncbi:phage integrase N-terminal SAM-like domain-containing protein, partial [Candidatus Bipolaricaulota bacterium]|nr:phage integrase N-terminal SAM-like domain-containing protein [Candidatus Bipolaricaulota bacterium]